MPYRKPPFMLRLPCLATLFACLILAALPQQLAAQDWTPLQDVLQTVQPLVASPSRGTVGQVLDALQLADAPGTPAFLRAWADREVFERP